MSRAQYRYYTASHTQISCRRDQVLQSVSQFKYRNSVRKHDFEIKQLPNISSEDDHAQEKIATTGR